MSTHCPACGEVFREGDKVQQLPPILELRRGDKSGELGWYQTLNSQTDFVHVECVQGFYQVENTPAWDDIDRNLREQVREEEREEIRQEVKQEIAGDHAMVCIECLEELDKAEILDLFTELGDKVLHEPYVYLGHLTYPEAYDLYVRFGHALTAMHQQTQR